MSQRKFMLSVFGWRLAGIVAVVTIVRLVSNKSIQPLRRDILHDGFLKADNRPQFLASRSVVPRPRSCRLEMLEETCARWRTVRYPRYQDHRTYQNLLVDDRHRLLYCIVPKAGCTSFQTLIANLTGALGVIQDQMSIHSPQVLARAGFRYLDQYSLDETIWRLENYYKLMVVRHPYERLYSAYKDKIVGNPYYRETFRPVILKHFDNENLTFAQFAELVTKEYFTSYVDRHWQRYDEVCHPCAISYDYIAKLETLSEDLPNILEKFRASDGSIPVLQHLNSVKSAINWSGSSNPYNEIHEDVMISLRSLYQLDMETFGYSWENGRPGYCFNKACC